MKAETRKRLDRLILLQRLKVGAVATGILLAITGLFVFIGLEEEAHIDKVTASRPVRGVITRTERRPERKTSYNLTVRLEDGREVTTIMVLKAHIPFKGDRVELNEIEHASGRLQHVVTGLAGKAG